MTKMQEVVGCILIGIAIFLVSMIVTQYFQERMVAKIATETKLKLFKPDIVIKKKLKRPFIIKTIPNTKLQKC